MITANDKWTDTMATRDYYRYKLKIQAEQSALNEVTRIILAVARSNARQVEWERVLSECYSCAC